MGGFRWPSRLSERISVKQRLLQWAIFWAHRFWIFVQFLKELAFLRFHGQLVPNTSCFVLLRQTFLGSIHEVQYPRFFFLSVVIEIRAGQLKNKITLAAAHWRVPELLAAYVSLPTYIMQFYCLVPFAPHRQYWISIREWGWGSKYPLSR